MTLAIVHILTELLRVIIVNDCLLLLLLLLLSKLNLVRELVDLFTSGYGCSGLRAVQVVGAHIDVVHQSVVESTRAAQCAIHICRSRHCIHPHFLLQLEDNLVLARLRQLNLALQSRDFLLELRPTLNEIVDVVIQVGNDAIQVVYLLLELAFLSFVKHIRLSKRLKRPIQRLNLLLHRLDLLLFIFNKFACRLMR